MNIRVRGFHFFLEKSGIKIFHQFLECLDVVLCSRFAFFRLVSFIDFFTSFMSMYVQQIMETDEGFWRLGETVNLKPCKNMSVFLKLGGAPDGPDNYRDTIFLPQTGKTSSDLKNMSFPQLCQIHTMLTYLRCGRRSVEFNESDLKSHGQEKFGACCRTRSQRLHWSVTKLR